MERGESAGRLTGYTAPHDLHRLLGRALDEPVLAEEDHDFVGVLQPAGDVSKFAQRDHHLVGDLVRQRLEPLSDCFIVLLVFRQLLELLFRHFEFLKSKASTGPVSRGLGGRIRQVRPGSGLHPELGKNKIKKGNPLILTDHFQNVNPDVMTAHTKLENVLTAEK